MVWTAIPADKQDGYLVTANDWNDVLNGNIAHVANMVLGAYWANSSGMPPVTVETIADASPAGRWVGAEVGDIRFGPFTENILAADGTPLWLVCGVDGFQPIGNDDSVVGMAYSGEPMRRLFNKLYNTDFPMFQGTSYTPVGKSGNVDFDWNRTGATARTFFLPDLRGRIPLGVDNLGGSSANRVTDSDADLIGNGDGDDRHILTIAEFPVHSHSIPSVGGSTGNGPLIEGANAASGTLTTGSAGGGAIHNNLPPYLTIGAIIYTGN